MCSQSCSIKHAFSALQGNLILTDANYEILTLLRSHRDDNKGISFMARHPYPIHSIRLRMPLDMSQLQSALDSADDKQTLRGRHPAPGHSKLGDFARAQLGLMSPLCLEDEQ